MIQNLKKDLRKCIKPGKAKLLSGFFKTGKGEYGEGDIFLGVMVPESRKIAQKYKDLSFAELDKLIKSKFHEERLVALFILVFQYKNGDDRTKNKIYKFYLSHTKYINNWDLVDLSASYIVGTHLLYQDKKILIKLARSKHLWERRIAIIATFAFIYKGESDWTFRIAEELLKDKEDLIHKACGWMLREVGKRVKESRLEAFLRLHGAKMPRTMLRYAIKRLPEKKRLKYLKM